jgi:hypothetical protein
MGACPELSPSHKNKLLHSSSIVSSVNYNPEKISYQTFDSSAEEVLRMKTKPEKILAGNIEIPESNELTTDAWTWSALDTGGVLRINHQKSNRIVIQFN